MAYTRPPSKTAGDVFDLTAYNAIRDSLIAGVDQVTTKGDLLVGTGADTVTRVGVGANASIPVADSGEAAGMRWQITPRVVVTRNSAFDPTPDEWNNVPWDAENHDTNGLHSTVTNNSRLTIPSGGAGAYRVGANIGFLTNGESGGSGHYGIRIRLNGSTVVGTVLDEAEMNGHDLWKVIEIPVVASVAGYYELQVYTTRDVDVSGASIFWAEWRRAT